jgi:antitoxin (DNA-binding transcriptional repressor) of toxin-antitoxin stability system
VKPKWVDDVASRSYIVSMKTIGLRELKNGLSRFVREVRQGQEILVTDRGQVVAELRPPTPPEARRALHPGIAALARRGLLTPATPGTPARYARLPALMPAGSALRLLAAERGEQGG